MPNTLVISKYLLDLLISFAENYLIILLLQLFFYKKKNYSIIIALFFTIISTIVNNFFYPPIIASLFLLFLMYGYTYLFLEGKFNAKIIIPLLIFANLFIVNLTVSSIYMLFPANSSSFISSLNYVYFMTSIIQKIILFFEYIFLKKRIHHNIYLTNTTWILIITLVSISMLFPIILYNEYLNTNIKDFYIVCASLIEFVIINILIYCILIHTYSDHKKITEQQLLLKTVEYENQMCAFIEKKIDDLNKVNHDMHNHMLIVKKLSESNKNNEIENYIKNIVFEPSSYINTSNNIVNYLLNEKIKISQEFGIDIKCLIQGDLKTTISPVDLSIVIGNLLDNAIEGAKKSKNKYININIVQDNYKLVISVTNSFDGKVSKSQDILISTKPNGFHGYGISNIKQVCKKYNGNSFINIDKDKFSHVCSFLLINQCSI